MAAIVHDGRSRKQKFVLTSSHSSHLFTSVIFLYDLNLVKKNETPRNWVIILLSNLTKLMFFFPEIILMEILLYSLSQNCLPIENRHVPTVKETPKHITEL
jgi:hypothetical protein